MAFRTVRITPPPEEDPSDSYISQSPGSISDLQSYVYASDGTFWATYVTNVSYDNGYGSTTSSAGYAGHFDENGQFTHSIGIASETSTFRIFSEWLYSGGFPLISLANGDIAFQSTFGEYARYSIAAVGRRGAENWDTTTAEYQYRDNPDPALLQPRSGGISQNTVELTDGSILSQVSPNVLYSYQDSEGNFSENTPETAITVINSNGSISVAVDYDLGSSQIWADPVFAARSYYTGDPAPSAAFMAARAEGGFTLVFLTGTAERPTGWQIQDYTANGTRRSQLDVEITEDAGTPVAVQTLSDGRLVIVTATADSFSAQIYAADGTVSTPVALPFSGADTLETIKIDGFLEAHDTAGFTWVGQQGSAYLAMFDGDNEQWSMLAKVPTSPNATSDIAAESAEDGSFALRWISQTADYKRFANAHVFEEFAPTFSIEDSSGETGYFDWTHVLADLSEGDAVTFLEGAEFASGLFHTTLTTNQLTLNGTDGADLGVFLATGVDELSMTGTDSLRAAGTLGQTQLRGNDGDNLLLGDTITLQSEAAQVYRLYRAALNRDPDAVSFSGMIDLLVANQDLGLNLSEFAAMFVNSREFSNRYGDLDAANYVTLLYQNVLNRAPDVAGLAGWVAHMDAGMSRESVLVGFSQSMEFQRSSAFSAAEFAVGLAADATGSVFRLYQATLDRVPDVAGFTSWSSSVSQGATLTEIVSGFVGSREFQNIYGSLSASAFVEQLYQNVLNRPPDVNGFATWTDRLANGATRESIVLGFSESQEFINTTSEPLEAWIRGLGEDDVLEGGSGDNTLAGGLLSDRFVFTPSDGGAHRVLDLEAWDTLDFSDFGYATGTAARGFMTQVGDDVFFSDQGVEVTLENTLLSEMSDSVFQT